jgi:tetratricopeptide (TPR) repeat protein
MESLTLITSADDLWSTGTAYGNLGIVELTQGNAMEAKALLQISIPLFADLGMLADVAYFMTHLGDAALLLGAKEEAESHWLDALRLAQETEVLPTVAAILIRFANLYGDRGDIARAYEWASLVAAHPDFHLVISYNPGYQSVLKDLKESTKQRFAAIDFAYPDPDLEAEIAGKSRRGEALAVCQLVEHAHLGQGERALQIPFPQYPDPAGPEPVEPSHSSYALIKLGLGHRYTPSTTLADDRYDQLNS